MENIEAMLCAYVEGDLDAAGREQIEKHLHDHPQHRKLMVELMAMRDLVRGLPRVKAPVDVGESLRGQVERSILLDDSPDAGRQLAVGSRWPQVFAIAAIFLLCASLCLVLYKALLPTLKPAAFTQSIDQRLSVLPSAEQMTPMSVPTTRRFVAVYKSNEIPQDVSVSPPVASVGALEVQHPPTASLQQAVAPAQLNNVEIIRRRLQNSGYDLSGASAGAPILLVVNSTDPPATNAQIAQFLSNSSGISWKLVPATAETNANPTTLPSANFSAHLSAAVRIDNAKDNLKSVVPTTQPASDVYVAKGLTAQQADALRQSLADRQSGAEVQVSLQSAVVLATTQPSAPTPHDDGANASRSGFAGGGQTTQPSEAANSSVDLTTPTTVPSDSLAATPASGATVNNDISTAGNRAAAVAGNIPAALSDNSQILQSMDAVIVVQSAPPNVSTPGSAAALPLAGRVAAEENSTPATQPSPSTQP
jgi:hypothetical protein